MNEPLQAAPWSLVTKPQFIPGYAYGFAYPAIRLEIALPVLTASVRARLWSEYLELYKDLPVPPNPTQEEDAGSQGDDRSDTIRWLMRLFDRLSALAGLPVVQAPKCVAMTPVVARFVVPTLTGTAIPLGHLLIKAIEVLRALSEDAVPKDQRSQWKVECERLFGNLRQRKPPASNTPRLIRAAVAHNIPFQELPGTQVIQFGLGRRAVLFDSTFTEFTSNLGSRLARQKYEAAAILRRNRLPVARHGLASEEREAIEIAQELGYPLVVKPADKDGGVGVRADLRNEKELLEGFKEARAESNLVLVETFVEGKDYRLYVFRGRCVWAVERQPAGVFGDGRSTIQQLVDAVNRDPDRGEGPHSPLKSLKLDEEAMGLLRREGLTPQSVPQEGRFARLRRTANISAGGMPFAVMDKAHPDNKLLAVRAAQALRLDVAGIDLIIPDIGVSWKQSGGVICEVNAQPQLGGTTGNHLYPLLLKTMLRGDGQIPVVALLGGEKAELVSRTLSTQLTARGLRVGMHSRAGISIGDELREEGQVSQLAAGQMLSINPGVEVLVFSAVNAKLLQEGFPVPRIDILLFTGEALDRSGLDPSHYTQR